MSIFFIVVSVVSFCLKTCPDLRYPVLSKISVSLYNNESYSRISPAYSGWKYVSFQENSDESETFPSNDSTWNGSEQYHSLLIKERSEHHEVFDIIELVCNAWFTFELTVRFVVSPSKIRFFTSLLNIIDFIATSSFILDQLLSKLHDHGGNDFNFLEFFSIIRIMRLFKLTKHSPGVFKFN